MPVDEAAPQRVRPLVFNPGHPFGGAPVSSTRASVVAQYEDRLDPAVERTLVEFGGVNPYGQPYYRIVWGYQRGHWVGGEYMVKYSDHERHRERWHLEKWVPAESFGTPEQWYASAMVDVGGYMLNVLGPYPSEGDYVRVIIFENYHTGEFVRPEPDMVMEAIVRNRQHAEQSRRQIRDKITSDMAARKRAAADRMVAEMEEREAAFAFRSWMPVSGPMTPEYRRREIWDPHH